MKKNPDLTAEKLRLRVSYDSESGVMTWLTCFFKSKIGQEVGWTDKYGYRACEIDHKYHLVHRLAWLYVYGEWPKDEIDHINLNKSDYRISNLREASHMLNSRNKKLRPDNTCGVKGVSLKPWGKYQAKITVAGKFKNLGCFDNVDDAGAAYEDAAQKYFGEFHHQPLNTTGG